MNSYTGWKYKPPHQVANPKPWFSEMLKLKSQDCFREKFQRDSRGTEVEVLPIRIRKLGSMQRLSIVTQRAGWVLNSGPVKE